MSTAFKQPVSVLVVIHTPALEVLLLERAESNGLWQSVTGSREADESLADTALREVAEETGIHAGADALHDWQLANRFVIMQRWRGRYAPGVLYNTEHVFSLCVPATVPVRLAPGEHTAARWLSWREAAQTVFSWTNRDAIHLVARRAQAGQVAGSSRWA